jgi:hypothetical protein
MGYIKELVKNRNVDQTVYTVAELSQIVSDYRGQKLYAALNFARKSKDLIRITRGIYALNREYSREEFGNKLRIPSYVSSYSVLQREGVVFQPYSSVFLMAARSETLVVDGQKYIYRKMKDVILLNPLGITIENGVARASIERAICDKLYLDGDEHFDNLRSVTWDFMARLNIEVYANNKVIEEYIRKNNV